MAFFRGKQVELRMFNDSPVDWSAVTVTADKIAKGYTAYDRNGVLITGTMETIPEETITDVPCGLTYVTGRAQSTNYVRVGHNTSAYNDDAVWSFTTTGTVTAAIFVLEWDNVTASTGWSGEYEYVFAISTDSSSARTAYSDTHIAKAIVALTGSKGTATVEFTGLSLEANTTYYLRANQNGTTFSTMKAFLQAGNTGTLTTSI